MSNMSYKKQELLTLREYLSSPPEFWWGPCCSSFNFVLSYYVSSRSEFNVVISITISPYLRCLVRLYFRLFVGGLMSYLHYLCLFAYSGVQHILCCVFFRIVYPMLPVSVDRPL